MGENKSENEKIFKKIEKTIREVIYVFHTKPNILLTEQELKNFVRKYSKNENKVKIFNL